MITFGNLSDLKNFLVRDKTRKTFSPVRFINVDSMSEWFEVKDFLSGAATKTLPLSTFCAGSDTFPNLRRLRSFLRRERQDVVVLPLSEALRINPDCAKNELKNFLSLQEGACCTTRIYFLMYRLRSILKSLNISDQRRRECILSSRPESSDYSLTVVQRADDSSLYDDRLEGIRQYLLHWECVPKTKSTLITENAIHLRSKVFFDNVQVIVDLYDLLRLRYGLPAVLRKDFGHESDWRRLAAVMAKTKDFEQAFCHEFKVSEFDTSVFENFASKTKFQRWLLWLRCKVSATGYVFRCATAADTVDDFARRIYELILTCADEKNFLQLCRERQILLSLMKILPHEDFLKKVRTTEKFAALNVLTCHSRAEKMLIFETLQRFKGNEIKAARKILIRIFPALANYLANVTTSYGKVQADYFLRYRWLKVTNRLTEEFSRRVASMARSEEFSVYAIRSRNEIVTKEYSSGAAILFVDGLGAEYVNFLAADFETLADEFAVRYQIGRCNLPSVTELNKDFLSGREVLAEELTLDTLKHESINYPENILSELNFLGTLKEKVLRGLEQYDKIILCSDHGTSRLAVLSRQEKRKNTVAPQSRRVYKSGRYADALPDDEKLFPTALECDGKIIFADYSRFLQQGKTGCEVHGGATWEEALVPIITIERRGKDGVTSC